MKRQRMATIYRFPLRDDNAQLWSDVAAHLGVPHLTSRISRRPWGWLNAHARRLGHESPSTSAPTSYLTTTTRVHNGN